jgi:hypothetical protein
MPNAAAIERDGRPLIFVVRNGRPEWVDLNRGRDNGIETQVRTTAMASDLGLLMPGR